MSQLTGIIPPLPTAFDREEKLLPEKIKSNIQILSRFDLSGFLILGSNGELVMLTHKEKIIAYEAAREAIGKEYLMLAGTGGQSTLETIELTKQAAKAGADAALVLNPYYYKGQMTKEAIVKHYFDVADASSIPVIVYNMPANTAMDMDAGTILALSQHPNITGVKDSGGNLTKMGMILRDVKEDFSFLAGSAGFLLPALSMGASGGILALANIAPSQCADIFTSFMKGDAERAKRIQHQMIPVNTAVTRQWGVPALKAAMDYLGLYGGPARRPLLELEESKRMELTKLLDSNNVKLK